MKQTPFFFAFFFSFP
ncbi:TPA: pheA operon leader peptide PheL [Enterobacter hormaechei subsp. xiangfangensis]|nr:pheA operon leader peptide PheL [Enterobacter hormaechei subsp. xiangfangensis]